MITPGSRIRQMGWVAVLAACVALFALLSFQVQTVRSEVLLAEREIIGLEREVQMLETEFQTRASQRQLAEWNAVELGYQAPRADQYLDNERQLASLGVPAGPDAPSPIRVARSDLAGPDASPRDMVSPITGAPVTLASLDADDDAGAVFTEAFGDFLIEASPIRAAKAQSGAPTLRSDAVLMSADISQ
ncbi:hypothetical protein CD351_06090 [Erythrobacter sp. KY5]|uniref:hypothetical protein n=1 Tax=Erythrobacter sp. KY5 TaxID=2011159 RepID=UPI000DBF37E3|nr:hypothetical protein [Erythrobacter sp. KY5]AWW73995.1 hypothetical protein CD351_06090 [Erythrobacter sp. KY5]